ncbi:hypothetical protein [Rhizobium leguminosarum]|nr:hypothetical protein [Rhizobium leguminosarum]
MKTKYASGALGDETAASYFLNDLLHNSVSLLHTSFAACQSMGMSFLKTLHRLFFIAALLGIILGPVGIGAADSAMASSVSVAMAGMDMPDEMPCCPEQKPIKLDCGKACPLALLCTTAIVGQSANNHEWALKPGWIAQRFSVMPHAELASTDIDPPARPPRA